MLSCETPSLLSESHAFNIRKHPGDLALFETKPPCVRIVVTPSGDNYSDTGGRLYDLIRTLPIAHHSRKKTINLDSIKKFAKFLKKFLDCDRI